MGNSEGHRALMVGESFSFPTSKIPPGLTSHGCPCRSPTKTQSGCHWDLCRRWAALGPGSGPRLEGQRRVPRVAVSTPEARGHEVDTKLWPSSFSHNLLGRNGLTPSFSFQFRPQEVFSYQIGTHLLSSRKSKRLQDLDLFGF